MNLKISLIALLILIPVIAYSQNDRTLSDDSEEDAYNLLLDKGDISISLDISAGTNKRKGAKNMINSSVNITDYYIPYLSFSSGILDRLTLGVDLAYKVTKINVNAKMQVQNQTVSKEKTISGLDIITLWGSLGIMKEHKMRPSMVLNSYFYLPNTGKEEFQTKNLGFFPELSFHNTFSDEFDLSYSAGVTWDGSYEYPVYSLVLSPGYYLNDNMYIYAELWNSFDFRSSMENYLTFDISYFGIENFSIDLYGGSTFQKPRENLFGGITLNYWFTAF